MDMVHSRDGTPIAFERFGSGPPLILVDGALCSRAFGPMPRLAPLFAPHFTVYLYDRRGRGGSGDTRPYAREREVEDIAALIDAAGGSASLLGLSSGAALALHAAASGLPVTGLVLYEPPFMVDDGGHHARANHEAQLTQLIAAGRRGDAVRYFMRDMVGMPGLLVAVMRLMFGMWRKLEAVAHTLPYDAAVMGDFAVPGRASAIRIPTLAVHGEKTDRRLRAAVEAVAAVVPGARLGCLAGQRHDVRPEVLAPAATAFLLGGAP